MKTLIAALCFVAVMLVAVSGETQRASAAHTCATCGRILGKEVPESALSNDPDFKKHSMFQVCQHCLNKRMSKRVQANYIQVALKYKWSSITHNLSNDERNNGRRHE